MPESLSEQSEYITYDAMGLAELVRKRNVSPRELVDVALRRADALNMDLNAVVVRRDDAVKEGLLWRIGLWSRCSGTKCPQTVSSRELQQARDTCQPLGRNIAALYHGHRLDMHLTATMAFPPVEVGELSLSAVERVALSTLRRASTGMVLRTVLSSLAL